MTAFHRQFQWAAGFWRPINRIPAWFYSSFLFLVPVNNMWIRRGTSVCRVQAWKTPWLVQCFQRSHGTNIRVGKRETVPESWTIQMVRKPNDPIRRTYFPAAGTNLRNIHNVRAGGWNMPASCTLADHHLEDETADRCRLVSNSLYHYRNTGWMNEFRLWLAGSMLWVKSGGSRKSFWTLKFLLIWAG